MSSIMRWRSGLMGLSDIAKAPVSHGVEPHDLETGLRLRFRLQPSEPSAGSPRLPRERFRSRVDLTRWPAVGERPLFALSRQLESTQPAGLRTMIPSDAG